MKQLIAASAIALTASTAFAGGMAPPVMDVEIVEDVTESRSSSAGLLIPLIVIAALVAISQSGGDDPVDSPSDIRMKTDITRVGTTETGLPLYQYRYLGDARVFEGVMAQDVLAHTPEAVTTLPNGLLTVNYGLLGLTLNIVE